MTGFLLDTHALLWWMSKNPRLPAKARETIEARDAEVFASSVNAFEIALKHHLGKLGLADRLLPSYEANLTSAGLKELSVTTAHALRAGSLAITHRDPFDRLLIAQAQIEGLTLVSNERMFDGFGIARLWN